MTDHNSLPVHGYTPQPQEKVDLVNHFKQKEEEILRDIDEMYRGGKVGVDPRWLAVGRTHLEQAFMAINRSIFRPTRVKLPGDPQ